MCMALLSHGSVYLESILIMTEANILLRICSLGTGQLSLCKFSAVYEWGNILESAQRHYSNTTRGSIFCVSKQFLFAYGSRDEIHSGILRC